jgi:hypothetical protein
LGEISIIEFIVYGLVGYSGIVLLIASAFKELPATKNLAVIRSIWIMPCIFMMYVLASAGAPIILQDEVIVTTLNYNETSNALVSNSTETTQAKQVSIVNPVWVTVHLLFFIMLVIYFIWNMLQLLVKRD